MFTFLYLFKGVTIPDTHQFIRMDSMDQWTSEATGFQSHLHGAATYIYYGISPFLMGKSTINGNFQ